MSAKVWLVTTGEYSDYNVKCACSTKKTAETVAAKMRGVSDSWDSDAKVQECSLVTADVEQVAVLSLQENLWDGGASSDMRRSTRLEWPFDPLTWPCLPVAWRWVRAPMHKNLGGRLEVWGTDHKRVEKTFSDRRAQVKADDAFRLTTEAKGRA